MGLLLYIPSSLDITSHPTLLLHPFSVKVRRKSSAGHTLCSIRPQSSLSFKPDPSRRFSESTLSHNYYNTVHGASSDKHTSNYVPLTSIFSTKVITGAKSTPDLNKLLERKQAGLLCSETAVVTPLETLNTNLNYKILDDFIGKITNVSTRLLSPTPQNNDNKKDISSNETTPNISPTPTPYISTNRFYVQSVDNQNSSTTSNNDKKSRVGFSTITHYSINTITELPEKVTDDER